MIRKKIPFGYPVVNDLEIKSVTKVLKGHIFAHGPNIKKFEQEFSKFTKAPYSISVSSCTAGMHLIYFTLGIGRGDEVIVPSQTHVATAHAVELTGAKPIFVDADNLTGNIAIDQIEKKITSKTKAIAVVHYLGLPVDMYKINKIAKKYKLLVIEDCALSIGAKVNKIHAGLLGDAGVFSFYPVKHITTGEGGMIITKNKKLAEKLKLQRGLGVDKSFSERRVPGVYDVVSLGFNYRMNEIQAAIGVQQLKKLPSFLKARKKNFNYLSKLLNQIDDLRVLPGKIFKLIGSHYCLSIILSPKLSKKREKIIKFLSSKGIGTSIYYPQPVPRMSYYKKKYKYKKNNFLNCEEYSDQSIALPVGPHIKTIDCMYMYKNISKIISKLR
jgi:perosamine synthetase